MNPLVPAWYCLRSQPKHEHIAAANLRQLESLLVFCPRFRVRRSIRGRAIWRSEPVFPGYLFARFALQPMLDPVRYTSGVKHVVQFGGRWPAIPDETIEELREGLGGKEFLEEEPDLKPGEEVRILDGPFSGLTVVVQRYMPAPQRVRVLLEVLGQMTPVELNAGSVSPVERYPRTLLQESAAA